MFLLFQSETFIDDKKDGGGDSQLTEFLSDRFSRKNKRYYQISSEIGVY